MPMTEKEIEELMAEVGEVDWTDPIVIQWLEGQLENARIQEKQLQGAATIHKMLRRDAELEQAMGQLRDTRKMIAMMEDLLADAEEKLEE